MTNMADIKGYEGLYAVTKDGRVWSYPKKNKYNPNHNGLFLNPTVDSNGYAYISLHKNGKQKKESVHRVVAFAFIPAEYNKDHVNHIDGDKLNNSVENLEWCTPQENCVHAYKNGLSIIGKKMREISSIKMHTWNLSERGKKHCSDNGKSRRKLSKLQVDEIKRLHKSGISAYKMANNMPVSKQTILKIIRNETYKDIA